MEKTKDIPSGSVDLVLIDPPYGTVKGLDIRKEAKTKDRYHWDTAINPRSIFEIALRLLRENGRLISFAMEPYTSHMIIDALPDLPLSYKMIWEKDNHANLLSCNKCPLGYFEEILMYQKPYKFRDLELENPLRTYFRDVLDHIGKPYKQVNKDLGHRKAEHCLYVTRQKVMKDIGGKADHCTRVGTSQFGLCTAETYGELIERYGIDKMPGFRGYEDLKKEEMAFFDEQIKKSGKVDSVFNLKPGEKCKSNIFKYSKPSRPVHPTQKPTVLLGDLIETFSNHGDTVADFTMGSGSTGVACVHAERNFYGIEQEEKYFNIAVSRIKNANPLFFDSSAVVVER